MKRLRILALSMALLLICLSPAVMPCAGAAKSYTTCPYWIGVDVVNYRLTVYRVSDNGAVHRWLCSAGRAGSETPTGVFYMPEKKGDERKDWCTLNGYKVRYASRVDKDIYIHSVQYTDNKDDAVRLVSLARLGHRGSRGSVIVEYVHAKWISQNCPEGTMVVVHAGVKDPLIVNRLKGAAGTETTESLSDAPTVESIEMVPASEFSIAIGETRQLSCIFKPSDAECSLGWESSDTKHATVDGNGLVRGVGEGKSTIKARTVNGKDAKVKVSVYDATKPTGVSLSASIDRGREGDRAIVYVNDGFQMTAKLSPSTAVSGLEWKSTNTKRATVNSKGWVKVIGEGNFEIEVKTSKEGKEDKYKFKAIDITKPTDISLSAKNVSLWDGDRAILKKGEGIQLVATVSPSTAVTDLEWKSTNTDHGKVNANGWVTYVGDGDFEVEVKTTREGKKAKLKFKAVDQPKKIKMTYAPNIKVGETVKFKVEIEPIGTSSKLTWSSSNNSIATVDSNGNVHGKAKGKVKITVKTENGKDATEKVKVK